MQLGTCHFPFQVFHCLFITGPSSSIWQRRPSTTAPATPIAHLKLYILASAKLLETTACCVHTLCHVSLLCFFCSSLPFTSYLPIPKSQTGCSPSRKPTCLLKEEAGPPWVYYLWMFRFSRAELCNQFICLYYLHIFLLPSYYIMMSFMGILSYYLCIIISCPHPEGR